MNYRFLPQTAELAHRVASGELGQVHLARGSYLQDWLLLATDENWRLDTARGGASRTTADIGVHWLVARISHSARRLRTKCHVKRLRTYISNCRIDSQ